MVRAQSHGFLKGFDGLGKVPGLKVHGAEVVVRRCVVGGTAREVFQIARGRYLGSRNGTCVDGKPVQSAQLTPGSSLRIGHVTIEVMEHHGSECRPPDDETTPCAAVHDSSDTCLRAARFGPVRKQVLLLLLDGLSEKQIAARLDMRGRTVHWHTGEIYEALDVQTRAELAAHFRNRAAISTACTTEN